MRLVSATAFVCCLSPAALAQCVTVDQMVCGPAAGASVIGQAQVARGASLSAPRGALGPGDRIVVGAGGATVAMGACSVPLPVNATVALVRRGELLCVSGARPVATGPGPNPTAAFVAAYGVGLAVALGAGRDDRPAPPPFVSP